MRGFVLTLIVLTALIATTSTALAVPPPDFLFNLGSSLVQVFAVSLVFLSAILYTAKQYAKAFFVRVKHKKVFWGALAGVILLVSFGGAYFFQQFQQEAAYDEWMKESEAYAAGTDTVDTSLDMLMVNGGDSVVIAASVSEDVVEENEQISFIRSYYRKLAEGKLEEAYAVSKKSVPFTTFNDWYRDVLSVDIDSIQEIEDMEYSLRLTLNEKKEITSYGVLLTLAARGEGYRIADSTSRVLSTKAVDAKISEEGVLEVVSKETVVEKDVVDSEFDVSDQPVKVTNPEFIKILAADSNAYVLDAREDEEYEIGQFPGSVHIRFADLLESTITVPFSISD
jgi:hypothetical protein